MLIDVHTHRRTAGGNTAIYNLAHGEKPHGGLFSVGIHPWRSGACNEADAVMALDMLVGQIGFAAVGEIGIDRACGVPLEVQVPIFRCQLEWAVSHHIPVIVHCVRAYSDILHGMKHLRGDAPVIFHAYCANAHITQQLCRHNAYFSLGMRQLMHPYAQFIPKDRLFLETDDSSAGIDAVYAQASASLCIDYMHLQDSIQARFERVFGASLHAGQH